MTIFSNPRVNVYAGDDRFSVEIIGGASFPEVTLRYTEGSRTMDVIAEALSPPSAFALYRSQVLNWKAPHSEEVIDDATRMRVFENIRAALEFGGMPTR